MHDATRTSAEVEREALIDALSPLQLDPYTAANVADWLLRSDWLADRQVVAR